MKISRPMAQVFGLFTLALLVTSCSQKETGKPESQAKAAQATPAQDQDAIRALDADWSRAVAAKDADKSASFYAENGTLLAPGAPIATGKDAIRKTWAGLMATPGFALSFTPNTINVSQSGDLAYELGTYSLTTNDKRGKPQTMRANYVVVWGKQADGSWKALVDAPTTTQ
ncbi:MAG TPA: SgcJ/EcaC family oxidoreductase [Candidatus Acidoferrales bacterium]|nr:SgcJ/EcaC family oxidoreductase [Candidatus Acidoferrales bacterium]